MFFKSLIFFLIALFSTNIILSCNIYEMIGEEPTIPDQEFYDNNYNGYYLNDACSADSGCQHWYVLSDFSSLFTDGACSTNVMSDGELIRCLRDNKGGNDMARAGGNTGNYEAAGTGFKLEGNSTAECSFANIDPLSQQTIIIVLQLDVSPPANRYFFGNGDTGPSNVSGMLINSSNQVGIEWGAGGLSFGGSSLTTNQKYVLSLTTRSSTNYDVYLNGNHELNGSVGGSFNSVNDMGFGCLMYGSTQNGADYTLHELVVYNYEMSDNERQKVEQFLKSKWGI
jgi:hypothetical protein